MMPSSSRGSIGATRPTITRKPSFDITDYISSSPAPTYSSSNRDHISPLQIFKSTPKIQDNLWGDSKPAIMADETYPNITIIEKGQSTPLPLYSPPASPAKRRMPRPAVLIPWILAIVFFLTTIWYTTIALGFHFIGSHVGTTTNFSNPEINVYIDGFQGTPNVEISTVPTTVTAAPTSSSVNDNQGGEFITKRAEVTPAPVSERDDDQKLERRRRVGGKDTGGAHKREAEAEPVHHGKDTGGAHKRDAEAEPVHHGKDTGGAHKREAEAEPINTIGKTCRRKGCTGIPYKRSAEPVHHGKDTGGAHKREADAEAAPINTIGKIGHRIPYKRSAEAVHHGKDTGGAHKREAEAEAEPVHHGKDTGGAHKREVEAEAAPVHHGKDTGGAHKREAEAEAAPINTIGTTCRRKGCSGRSPYKRSAEPEPVHHGKDTGGAHKREAEPVHHGKDTGGAH